MWALLAWPVVGAAIGYHAAGKRGFTKASGAVSGAVWGGFAFLLYFYDWPYVAD